MIESYLLEHLVVFSEHRTLSETASVLHLTQPTLTRSMNKLEETFGVPLFTREKKRIRLNENGWMAARYAKEILREEEKMIAPGEGARPQKKDDHGRLLRARGR